MIEGAAVTFQNAWYKSNWYSLSFFEDKNWSDVDVSIANITNPYLYKEVRKSIQGSIPRDQWIDGYSPDWYLSDLENTYDRGWSCRYANTMATAYIAYKTSYKAVWIDIPQNYYELGWWGAFEKHVGLTKQEFFDEYNQFLRSGNPEDEPPIGWSPPDGPISEYANLFDIIPAS